MPRPNLLIGLCALLAPVASQAQVDAGSLLNQQQRQQQKLPERLPEAERQPLRPALQAPAGMKFTLKAVRFTGAQHLATPAELQAVVSPAIGREIDFAGVEQLAAQVTELLKRKGWFLARAYLPRQDVTDGALEIIILEGRLDGSAGQTPAYRIATDDKHPLRIRPERLTAIAQRQLPAGATAREDSLERAALLMNDLPGISARAHLEAGSEPDSTRVVLDVLEGPLFSASAWADNYGSRDTGSEQQNIAVQLNDAAHWGDQASLSATHTDGLDLARLGASLPLGSNGLKLATNLSSMSYKVLSATGLAAGLKGNSQTAGLSLSHPYLRSRAANVNANLGYTLKALKDESTAGTLREKQLGNWNVGVSADANDSLAGGGVTTGSLSWTYGRVDLHRNAGDAASDATGYQTAGHFDKFSLSLARLQKLPGAFTLAANLSGQTASRNLDSSEQFILGGSSGVRAYSGSDGMGDQGWLASLEVRYDLPPLTPLGQIQASTFYDTGHIQLHRSPNGITIPTATGRNSYGLAGWGVSLSLAKTSQYSVRAIWASTVGSNPGRSSAGLNADSLADKSRLWLQATAWF